MNSRLNLMKKRDLFFPILKNTVPTAQVAPFSKNILSPKQRFALHTGRSDDAVPLAALHDVIDGAAARDAAAPLVSG